MPVARGGPVVPRRTARRIPGSGCGPVRILVHGACPLVPKASQRGRRSLTRGGLLYIFAIMQILAGSLDGEAHGSGGHGSDGHGFEGDGPDSGPDQCEIRVIDAERVAEARRRLPRAADIEEVASMFKLMSDPNRLRILYALRSAGELCVCDVAAAVGVSETGVSQSMRLLRSAGVVRRRREGRVVHYSLDDDHVEALVDMGLDHLQHSAGEQWGVSRG